MQQGMLAKMHREKRDICELVFICRNLFYSDAVDIDFFDMLPKPMMRLLQSLGGARLKTNLEINLEKKV